MAPQLVFPVDDPAAVVECRLHAERHRRAVGFPGEFVLAHPLQLDRAAAGGARDQGGVERDIVGAVVPVAARTLAMADRDAGFRHPQRLGQVATQREHALGVAPDLQLAVFPVRHRARRADRAVRLKWPGVVGFQHTGVCRRRRPLDVADHRGARPHAFHPFEQAGAVRWQVALFVPFGRLADRLYGGDRLLFPFGGDTEETAVAQHRHHARHTARGGVIKRQQPGARRGRAHHPAEQHAGQAHVLHIGFGAGHLAGDIAAPHVLADHLEFARELRLGARARFALEHVLARQFPVGRLLPGRVADRAVAHAERGGAHTKLDGGGLEQHLARFGAGEAQGSAAVLDRQAAGGHAFIRRARGVARDHLHPLVIDVEFIGGDLRQRGGDALPEFHLAGEHRDAAIAVDRQPAAEHAIVLQAAGQARRARRLLCAEFERRGQ